MFRYFTLQFKRICKLLPYVGLSAAVLFGALFLVLNGIVQMFTDEDADTKLRIGIVGEAEDSYLEMGMAALQSIDSARYSIEVVQMEEPEARSALEAGTLAAYVVIPEGFVDAALDGKVMTIEYVSTMSARGLVSMFKDEITKVIADVVLACQRGMYGIEGAFEAMDAGGYGKYMNRLSASYARMVLLRSKMYAIEEFGLHDRLGLEGYLFSGICVLFFALSVLPFGQLLIKQDLSLNRLVASKCGSSGMQTVLEFLAFFVGYTVVMLSAFALVLLGVRALNIDLQWLFGDVRFSRVWQLVPVLLLVSSFGFMIFCFMDNLVSGNLLQFFAVVAMCFIGGCMYPLGFFPDSIRSLAQYLPHSLARQCISGFLTDQASGSLVLWLLGYTGLFVSISAVYSALRMRKAGR